MSDNVINQYIKVDNEKIKYKSPGFKSTKMIGLYAMISTYLSNPDFEVCNGGLKTALLNRCSNGKFAFNGAWKELKTAGYLKRCRIPYDKNKFRDYYELLPVNNFEIPEIRNFTAKQGKQYLKDKPVFEIPKHNYTAISYKLLMDPDISLFAKGLFCIIQRLILIAASKSDFIITKEVIGGSIKEGSTAYNNAWRELKSSGYLQLTRIYDSSIKKFRYLYKLNYSPYKSDEKVEKKNVENPKKFNNSKVFVEPLNKNKTQIVASPVILNNTSVKYYTDKQRQEYNDCSITETWLPPAYELNDINKLTEQIKYQIQYDWLINGQMHSKEITDAVVEILTETALLKENENSGTCQNGNLMLKKAKFHKLDCDAVDFAITAFEGIVKKKKINAKKSYLTSILFNAERDMLLDTATV